MCIFMYMYKTYTDTHTYISIYIWMHVVVFREKGISSQLPAEDNERAGNVQAA